jgi:hypothetical protein
MDAQWKQRSSVTRSVDLMDWIFFIWRWNLAKLYKRVSGIVGSKLMNTAGASPSYVN